jgi:hypothetical protein
MDSRSFAEQGAEFKNAMHAGFHGTAFVIINPAKHGHWFFVFLEPTSTNVRLVAVVKERGATYLQFEIYLVGLSLELDQHVWESRLGLDDSFDSQLLLTDGDYRQDLLFIPGIPAKAGNILPLKPVPLCVALECFEFPP